MRAETACPTEAAVSRRLRGIERGQIGGEIPRECLGDPEIMSEYTGPVVE